MFVNFVVKKCNIYLFTVSNGCESRMSHFKHIVLLSMVASLLTFAVGCGQKLPPGMPKLYKTTIVIMQDGKPLPEANVVVVHEDFTSNPWTSGGVTDSEGKVLLKTEGQYVGVPQGNYLVAVSKVEGPPGLELPKNVNTDAEIRAYDKIFKEIQDNSVEVVDKKFMDSKATPLKIEVQAKSSEHILDVSPAVKNKVERGPVI